jgi:hypothetical protein
VPAATKHNCAELRESTYLRPKEALFALLDVGFLASATWNTSLWETAAKETFSKVRGDRATPICFLGKQQCVAGFQVKLQSAVSAAAGDTGGRKKYSKKTFWDLEAAQKYRESTTVLGVQD